MVEQLSRLRCLVALLATECMRRLDASTMRAGAQLRKGAEARGMVTVGALRTRLVHLKQCPNITNIELRIPRQWATNRVIMLK